MTRDEHNTRHHIQIYVRTKHRIYMGKEINGQKIKKGVAIAAPFIISVLNNSTNLIIFSR